MRESWRGGCRAWNSPRDDDHGRSPPPRPSPASREREKQAARITRAANAPPESPLPDFLGRWADAPAGKLPLERGRKPLRDFLGHHLAHIDCSHLGNSFVPHDIPPRESNGLSNGNDLDEKYSRPFKARQSQSRTLNERRLPLKSRSSKGL